MNGNRSLISSLKQWKAFTALVAVVAMMAACPLTFFQQILPSPSFPARRATSPVAELPDTIPIGVPVVPGEAAVVVDSVNTAGGEASVVPVDTVAIVPGGSVMVNANGEVVPASEMKYVFNPDPTRAVWLSALCPGLGQLYNRRYWKLPIVVGGFMGLGYATSWNNGMLRDYTRAYSDIMDNDPSTKSYMDFFPPTVSEGDLDRTWLTNVLKSRKDFYRRNRDLCIICMVGVYLIAMVDAYVDAQLAHFDISPNLSVDIAPALIPESRERFPGIGMQWAFNF